MAETAGGLYSDDFVIDAGKLMYHCALS